MTGSPIDKISTARKDIQEEEYIEPYHWFIRPNTRKGIVYHSYWKLAIELGGEIKKKTILDAGCGDGYFTSMLVEYGPESITGIDKSERAIGFAKERVRRANFIHGSMEKMPFPDNHFDVIFLVEVLEHIPKTERKRIVNELCRVLKVGDGRLVITVPSTNHHIIEKHEEHFTQKSLEKALSPCFNLRTIRGQDRGGTVNDIFWFIFRLWKNRFWTLKPLINFWTLRLYPIILSESKPKRARRLVATFSKV